MMIFSLGLEHSGTAELQKCHGYKHESLTALVRSCCEPLERAAK